MGYWLKKLTYLVISLAGITFIIAWLLLSSSMLSGPRAGLTEWLLSRETGQTIEINGGVEIDLGLALQVSVRELRVPSGLANDVVLAEVTSLGFDMALVDLIKGQIRLSNLILDGASIVLSVDKDGTASWPAPDKQSETAKVSTTSGKTDVIKTVSGILSDHRIQLSNSGVIYRNARNGFEFDLHLSQLALSRPSASAPIELRGEGSLNGQNLSLTGDFPSDQPFKAGLSFEKIRLDLAGTPDAKGYEVGFKVSLDAAIDDLKQLQDILLLNDVLEGTGQAAAELVYAEGEMFVGDAGADISLIGGQSIVLVRTLGASGHPGDAIMDTTIRLYPENDEPGPTTTRRELKLVKVYMQLANRIDDVPLRKMVIATNGFVIDTAGVGPPPITVSGISRSSGGLLRLGGVALRLGPSVSPFVVLQGAISNALELDQVDVRGDLSLPIASLLAPELFQNSDVLGKIVGGFQLTGNKDRLSLSELNVISDGTDFWQLKVNGSVGDILTLNDIDMELAADVASGADLLSALDLEPIETGALQLAAKLTSQAEDWNALANIVVSTSELDFDVSLDANDPHPIVRGSVTSDVIKVEHIRDITAAALQINRLGDLEKAAPKAPEEVASVEQLDPELGDTGPFRDVSLLPLGRAILLSGMDLEIGIDMRKIEGDKGTTSLKSNLTLDSNKAQIGPVKFAYGGGSFNLTGVIDLKENPEVLKVIGSTRGWDFGKIMQAIHFKKSVSGVLSASFDVSGHHRSVQDFLKTAQGGATVSMKKGSIETQLLNIAGLGVLPWLFSKQKGDRAPIVCMRAPLQIVNGRIASKQVVVETDMVQIVVYGNVDLGKKTLDIHGQPRRIGKPLSRSPWPFSVSGALSNPKVKLKDGPRKVRRSDGASTMPKHRKPCIPDILQLQ